MTHPLLMAELAEAHRRDLLRAASARAAREELPAWELRRERALARLGMALVRMGLRLRRRYEPALLH
ncbi:MAG TPA: hypothetical protein VLJ14_04895 [Ktedonobacterales bacterium]|jgi:hypothetical protein|nr:hypothetical protein [Ktedonobacterales bacterium]